MSAFEDFYRRPAGFAFGQPDSFFELLDLFAGNFTFDPDDIGLGNSVSGMRQPVRQLAIVGQDNQAGGIGVESADTKDSLVGMDKVNGLFLPLGSLLVQMTPLGLFNRK